MAMRNRCRDKNNKNYNNYGGRGIYVCERWEKSFSNFLADTGPRPWPEAEIDRIDVNGPYSPENFRWATRIEQSRNMRKNVVIEVGEFRATIAEWAEVLGKSYATMYHRFKSKDPLTAITGVIT
jgi:hypothetical protein